MPGPGSRGDRAGTGLAPRSRSGDWRLVLFCYWSLAPVLALFAYVRDLADRLRASVLSFYKWNLIGPMQALRRLAQLSASCSTTRTSSWRSRTRRSTRSRPSSSARCWRCRSPCSWPASGRLSAFYQTVYFLPVITPMVPMAIAWKWIYDYNYGLLNYVLSLVGLPPVAWLTDPAIALWALVIMGVWKVLGYNLILFLVGIRNIPAPVPRGREPRRRLALAALRLRHPAAAAADPALRAGDRDDQRLQRLHPGLRDDAGLAGGAGPGGAGPGVRHLAERLPVLPHGLRLGRGGRR